MINVFRLKVNKIRIAEINILLKAGKLTKISLYLAAVNLGACGVFQASTPNAQVTPSDLPSVAGSSTEPQQSPDPKSVPALATIPTDTETETQWISSCFSKKQRIAQSIAVLLTPSELKQIKLHARRGEIGFIGLVGKHNRSVATSIKALQLGAPYPVLIASDEESRYVQRLSAAISPLPTMEELTSMTTIDVRRLYADYGRKMKELGITINFAPVLDVGYGPGIGTRAYGETAEKVIEYGRAVVDGLLDAGVMPVYKHFPGHGSASADSHEFLPTTRRFTDMGPDLAPYRQLLSDQVGVMVGHLLVPGLSDETPTSLSSPTIDGLLRTELRFDGLVFTDALNMGAIRNSYSTGEAAIKAIEAGADVVMIGGYKAVEPLIQQLLQSVESGRLTMERIDRSALKVYKLKGMTMPPGSCMARAT